MLEYVPPNDRERIIKNIQERTAPGGLNVLDTFVDKPFIEIAPDWEHGKEYFWRTGELFSYYNDWQIELLKEPIFDCDSAGVPHKHCMDMLIARKMGGGNGETRR